MDPSTGDEVPPLARYLMRYEQSILLPQVMRTKFLVEVEVACC